MKPAHPIAAFLTVLVISQDSPSTLLPAAGVVAQFPPTGEKVADRPDEGLPRPVALQRNPTPTHIGDLLWSKRIPLPNQNDCIIPACDGQTLFLPFADRVLAVSLQTGEPAWPTARPDDDGSLWRSVTRTETPRHAGQLTAIVAQGRLFTLTGYRALNESSAFPTVSAFDIATGEGKLLWSQNLNGELARAGWVVIGAPLIVDDRLWAAVRSRKSPATLSLASVTSADGGDLQIVPLSTDLPSATDARSIELCNAGDSILVRTSNGMLARIRRADRAEVWRVTLSDPSVNKDVRQQQSTRTPLVVIDDVVCAIDGSGMLTALSLRDGRLIWKVTIDDSDAHLAAVGGRILIAGRSLRIVDPRTGESVWTFGFTDAAGVGAGCPAVCHGAIAWSTRSELLLVNPSSGAVRDRRRLADLGPLTGGDVFLTSAHLILIGEGRVSVFQLHE